jgi:virulence-associated protein VagC
MKYVIKNISILLCILAMIFFTGCKKSAEPPPLPQISTEEIQEDTVIPKETTEIRKYDNGEDFLITEKREESREIWTISVDGYKGEKKEIRISPKMRGSPVLYIKDKAFYDKKLTSVSIPLDVEEIGAGAFMRNQLTSVTLPEAITKVGINAFAENPITTIIITSGFDVESGAFPNNFSDFTGASAKAGIYTWDGSSWSVKYSEYEDPKNFVFIINDALDIVITRYLGSNKTVKIPPRIRDLPVVIIYRDDWARVWDISSVIIPDTVKYIRRRAFMRNQLTSVIIPENVIEIGEYVFGYNQLTSVIIPDNVIDIGVGAFAVNQLTSVTLGKSVTSIDYKAFANNKLTSITIPDSVKFIGADAFSGNQLVKITMPENVSIVYPVPRKGLTFDNYGFDILYNGNGKKAGTYILNGGKWSIIQNNYDDEK